MTRIVVDTNVWLHCRFFRELPWVELVGDDTEILIPPVLLRELDKHKNGSRSNLRDRAGKVLKELEQILKETQLRAPVANRLTMTAIAREPQFADGLDKEIADDRFFATILSSPEPRPVFISNDFGVRIRARGLGLAVLEPPAEWQLPSEPDELQLLKREVEALKSAAPRPAMTFLDGMTHKSTVVRSIADASDLFVGLRMIELKQKHPLLAPQPFLSRSDIERANHALTSFYGEYEEYLRELAVTENLIELCVPVALSLSNNGSAPADDIDVILNLDVENARLVEKTPRRASAPEAPEASNLFGMHRRLASEALLNIPAFPSGPRERPNVVGPEFSGGCQARYNVRRLKHRVPIHLRHFYVRFDRPDNVKGFNIQYAIHAANLRKAAEGTLRLSVESRAVSFDDYMAERAANAKKRLASRAQKSGASE